MNPELEAGLLRYFAGRMASREERRERLLAGLTERERGLLQEGAVMGWVRGYIAAGGKEPVPGDSYMIADVVDGCLGMPELYPTIASAERER